MDKKIFWRKIETSPPDARLPLATVVDALRFDADGLLPVITQDADGGRVLMLAWMNREALAATLASRQMVYYSRSRQCLWRKGETSGNTQQLLSLAADCDGDALLAKVKQTGGACHTGRPSCFYVRFGGGNGGGEDEGECVIENEQGD